MTTTQNMPVFDTLDLKDRIIKLRENLQGVKQEKENLQTLVQAKERHLVQLRQDYTVLAPEDELRWTENEDTGSVAGGSIAGGSIAPTSADQKRLQVMNDKLEMQILSQEIRQALPALEQEAKQWEAIAKEQQKKLPKSFSLTKTSNNNNGESVTLLKSMQELEESNQILLNHILKLKTDKNQAIEKEGSANQSFFQEISTLRKLQHTLSSERQSLKILNQKLKNQHKVEEHRYHIATEEFYQCRNRLKSYHNGYGWQTEVFKSEAGSIDKRVLVRRIPTILNYWIRSTVDPFKQTTKKSHAEEETTQSTAVNLGVIKKLLVEIYEEDLDEVFQRESLMGSRVLPDDQQQTSLTAVSSNLSDDSFFRRQSVIAEHQVQMDVERAKLMDTHDENEEEELIVLPKNSSQKQLNPKSSQSTLNVSSSHASIRSRAEAMVENAADIDLKTFRMLCDRLVLLLEQQ